MTGWREWWPTDRRSGNGREPCWTGCWKSGLRRLTASLTIISWERKSGDRYLMVRGTGTRRRIFSRTLILVGCPCFCRPPCMEFSSTPPVSDCTKFSLSFSRRIFLFLDLNLSLSLLYLSSVNPFSLHRPYLYISLFPSVFLSQFFFSTRTSLYISLCVFLSHGLLSPCFYLCSLSLHGPLSPFLFVFSFPAWTSLSVSICILFPSTDLSLRCSLYSLSPRTFFSVFNSLSLSLSLSLPLCFSLYSLAPRTFFSISISLSLSLSLSFVVATSIFIYIYHDDYLYLPRPAHLFFSDFLHTFLSPHPIFRHIPSISPQGRRSLFLQTHHYTNISIFLSNDLYRLPLRHRKTQGPRSRLPRLQRSKKMGLPQARNPR